MQCELCQRELEKLTLHHLVPRQKTKRKHEPPSSTIEICSACHRQIHSLFDNRHLAEELNTLTKLKQEPQMAKFLLWVSKQKADKRIQVNRAKT